MLYLHTYTFFQDFIFAFIIVNTAKKKKNRGRGEGSVKVGYQVKSATVPVKFGLVLGLVVVSRQKVHDFSKFGGATSAL